MSYPGTYMVVLAQLCAQVLGMFANRITSQQPQKDAPDSPQTLSAVVT